MSKKEIDAIIDGTEMYAYAYLNREYGYGHMIVEIRLPATAKWSSRAGDLIEVRSQIGGDSNDEWARKPYAIGHRYKSGFGGVGGCSELATLEAAVKYMRRIDKTLTKLYDELGNPSNTAEYAQRALVAVGCKNLVVHPGYWASSTHNISDGELYRVGATSAHYLKQMEEELIRKFERPNN